MQHMIYPTEQLKQLQGPRDQPKYTKQLVKSLLYLQPKLLCYIAYASGKN